MFIYTNCFLVVVVFTDRESGQLRYLFIYLLYIYTSDVFVFDMNGLPLNHKQISRSLSPVGELGILEQEELEGLTLETSAF